MKDELKHPVYLPEVTSFVVVGREYCKWLETNEPNSCDEFVSTALKLLPLLYFKVVMLPRLESNLVEDLQVFVTEAEYEHVRLRVQSIMGTNDDYLEVFTADMQFSEIPLTASISENLADIYQDIKNFLMNYRSSTTGIMNEALVLLQDNFETYWGQRLVNVLRALHMVGFGGDKFDDEGLDENDPRHAPDTDRWLITRRQREYQRNIPPGNKS